MRLPPRFTPQRNRSAATAPPAAGADAQRRLRWLAIALSASLAMVAVRLIWISLALGPRYRQVAARSVVETTRTPAQRGRILDRQGTVLAQDEPTSVLTLHYRWLEEPADDAWIRQQARRRLTARQRRQTALVAQAEREVRAERTALRERLLALGAIDAAGWQAQVAAIQTRVRRTADEVYRRQLERHRAAQRENSLDQSEAPLAMNSLAINSGPASWMPWFKALLARHMQASPTDLPPPRRPIAEELAQHPLCDGLSAAAVAEIEAHPQRYPGVRLETRYRRAYPRGDLAAHVLGYVGPAPSENRSDRAAADDRGGVVGSERYFDAPLAGQPGARTVEKNRAGDELRVDWTPAPTPGGDVSLTIDAGVQTDCERVLDALGGRNGAAAVSGAIVAMDARAGALWALASAPRFAPQPLSAGSPDAAALLSDPRRPLYDRATHMALPPGGAVQPFLAAALLASGQTAPDRSFDCRQACVGHARATDHGHGELDLPSALGLGCREWFAAAAAEAPEDFVPVWLRRFGLGRPTGIELAGEAAGFLPAPGEGQPWTAAEIRALASGQGQLLVTPLQMACATAALVNGGRLVTPRVALPRRLAGDVALEAPESAASETSVETVGPIDETHAAPAELPLDPAALELVRAALANALQTSSPAVRLAQFTDAVDFAGVCTAASVDGPRRPHLWFVGFAPVDEPQVVLVIALEHAACDRPALIAAAQRLFNAMAKRGCLGPGFVTARAGHRAVEPLPQPAETGDREPH